MYLLRQINARLARGRELPSVGAAVVFPYRMTDVSRRLVLDIGDSNVVADSIFMDQNDSEALQLPEGYTNASRLSCIITSTQLVKVVIVSPDHGTSTFLLKGTAGTTDGDHTGVLVWQGTVTSITVTALAATDAHVEYMAWKLPDLTAAASYRDGARALGSV